MTVRVWPVPGVIPRGLTFVYGLPEERQIVVGAEAERLHCRRRAL